MRLARRCALGLLGLRLALLARQLCAPKQRPTLRVHRPAHRAGGEGGRAGLLPPPPLLCRGRRVALDVACALNYLHSATYTHFDVKARNVLLSRDLTAKLADVGFARWAEWGGVLRGGGPRAGGVRARCGQQAA